MSRRSFAPPRDIRSFVDLESIPTADVANIRLELDKGCRLLTSAFPIFSIWKVKQVDYVGDLSVSLDEGPQTVLVSRSIIEIELTQLTKTESMFADLLVAGYTRPGRGAVDGGGS